MSTDSFVDGKRLVELFKEGSKLVETEKEEFLRRIREEDAQLGASLGVLLSQSGYSESGSQARTQFTSPTYGTPFKDRRSAFWCCRFSQWRTYCDAEATRRGMAFFSRPTSACEITGLACIYLLCPLGRQSYSDSHKGGAGSRGPRMSRSGTRVMSGSRHGVWNSATRTFHLSGEAMRQR